MDTRLGGGIVDLANLSALAVDRTDIDDAAPFAFAHAGKYSLGHVETACQVDADHLVPLLKRHLHHRRIAGDARVVDHDIDRAEFSLDSRACIKAGLVVAHIPFAHGNSGAIRKFLGRCIIATIVGDDQPTLFLQLQTDCFTDAACTAGYYCYARHSPTPAISLSCQGHSQSPKGQQVYVNVSAMLFIASPKALV